MIKGKSLKCVHNAVEHAKKKKNTKWSSKGCDVLRQHTASIIIVDNVHFIYHIMLRVANDQNMIIRRPTTSCRSTYRCSCRCRSRLPGCCATTDS